MAKRPPKPSPETEPTPEPEKQPDPSPTPDALATPTDPSPPTPDAPASPPAEVPTHGEPAPAPAPDAAAPVATAEVDTYSAERLGQLVKAGKETAKAQARFLKSQARTKSLKKEWESALDKEHRLVLSSEQRPFKLGEPVDPPTIPDVPDDDDDDDDQPELEPTGKPEPKARRKAKPLGPVSTEDESWRGTVLNSLGIATPLPPALLSFLADADILTVGDLAKWTEPKPAGKGKRLTDIPGIGEQKAAAIENAMMEFWAAWAERKRASKEADSSGSDAGKPADPPSADPPADPEPPATGDPAP